jgi:SPASM domain peptide maturase of grasp-with-spasm system
MNTNTYFNLYSCCILVKGHKRTALCDLQRDKYELLPNVLYEILSKLVQKGKSILQIKEYFDHKYDNYIDEYFSFLESREYGFFSDQHLKFPKIDLKNYYEPKQLTNAIIDFGVSSTHTLSFVVSQLNICSCEALEIRYFYPIHYDELVKQLQETENSTLRDVEILIEFNDSYSFENLLQLRLNFPRLRKITLYNSQKNKILVHDEIYIIYTKNNISSENCCGVVNHWYFISKTDVFLEALNFNSCLNKKISIDKHGEIKNCPSMTKSYGNIKNTTLITVLKNTDFTNIWKITKDKIKVCKDCEFRYLCQDCRAYITDLQDIYSKPSKCKYNPYE